MLKMIAPLFLLFLSQFAFAQLKSERAYTPGNRAFTLNDKQIYQPEITWAITINNFMNVLQQPAEIKQIFSGTLGKHLAERVFRDTVPVYTTIYFGMSSPDAISWPKNGVITEPSGAMVLDMNLANSGYGLETWETEDGTESPKLDNELRNIFFTQNIIWNDVEKKLTSRITWIGLSRMTEQRVPLFYVEVTKPEQAKAARKLMWEADNYFKHQLAGEDVPLTKQMFDEDIGGILWDFLEESFSTAHDTDKVKGVALKDTNGITPITFQALKEKINQDPDTIHYMDPIMLEEVTEVVPEIFDPIRMQYFGVLQHITIYDDWSVSMKIKGVKLFYRLNYATDAYTPIGWVYFE